MTDMNIIDELEWRGLIAQSTDLDALRALAEDPHHGVRFAVQASQRQRLRAAAEQAGAPRGADPDALAATA